MPIFKFTQVSDVHSLCLYSLFLKILIRSVILAHQKSFFFSPSYACCLSVALNNELCLQRHSVALEVTWAYVHCGHLNTVGIRGIKRCCSLPAWLPAVWQKRWCSLSIDIWPPPDWGWCDLWWDAEGGDPLSQRSENNSATKETDGMMSWRSENTEMTNIWSSVLK